jgi:hypothetical protein
MVNARFPPAQSYGFEMVHGRFAARSGRIDHQSKIYGESIRRHFSQIFRQLISMQTLAIYQVRLVVDRVCPQTHTRQMRDGRKKTDDWSQDVVPAAFDLLAWARAGAAAQGQNA